MRHVRGSMKNEGFEIVDEYQVNYKDMRRGHYDIIVFNLGFIRNHNYSTVNGQTFSEVSNCGFLDFFQNASLLLLFEWKGYTL